MRRSRRAARAPSAQPRTGSRLAVVLWFAVLIVGVPFVILYFGSVRVLSLVEGRIVEVMLGERMPRRPLYATRGKPWLTRIGDMFTDPRTWLTQLYFLLMLPLGIIYFTLAVTLGVTSGAFIAGGFYELATGKNVVRIDPYPEVDALLNTPPGLVLLIIAGLIGILLTLHMARVIGFIHGKIAEGLLVRA